MRGADIGGKVSNVFGELLLSRSHNAAAAVRAGSYMVVAARNNNEDARHFRRPPEPPTHTAEPTDAAGPNLASPTGEAYYPPFHPTFLFPFDNSLR